MDPLELCEALGGEALMNKLLVKHNGKPQWIGGLVDGEYELNALGKTLEAEHNARDTVGVTPPIVGEPVDDDEED